MSSNAWLNAHYATAVVPLAGLKRAGSEIVPDSEEERVKHRRKDFDSPSKVMEVIEISSESEDEQSEADEGEACTSITMSPTKPSPVALPDTGVAPRPSPKKRYIASRRIIESSDEDSEVEIVDFRSTVVTESTITLKNTPKGKEPLRRRSPSPSTAVSEATFFKPRENGGIIVLDEPRSSRKPLAVKKANPNTSTTTTRKPKFPTVAIPEPSISTLLASGSPDADVKPAKCQSPQKAPRTPRTTSKKAQQKAQRDRLHAYAQSLFALLNTTVFDDGLPKDTKLNWNTRLVRTAGRAKFHRSRDGTELIEIELADKILDCEERIQHTLSHEMCHLATWVINQKMDEQHGTLFKSWAARVTDKHPHIHVSIKHDYEIKHPYEWKCQDCDKIYGRFSKSIKPEECVCGVCKNGKLIALFTTRKRTAATPKVSRFAASKPQDSPRVLAEAETEVFEEVPTESGSEDSVVEILTKSFAATSLTLSQ